MVLAQRNIIREWIARNPLVACLLLSLAIHSVLYSGWRMGKRLGWWDHQATWLLKLSHKKKTPAQLAQMQMAPPPQAQREIPLTFIEVDPRTVALEPPKDAKYYGVANAKAANADTVIESLKPKVDGKQEHVPRLENVPKAQPLQPEVKPEPPKKETLQPALAEPKPAPAPGDMAKAKPIETPKPDTGTKTEIGAAENPSVAHERPKSLAMARIQKNIPGESMKQDGGIKNHGKISFDVKQSPFGAYDAAFIAAVQQRWYELLDSSEFAQRSGKVVLEFKLNYDGRITDLKMNGNEVGPILGLLCEKAISDPAPFPKWPSDMRRMVGGNFREVTFTFYYN
jgi:hypothetical protein